MSQRAILCAAAIFALLTLRGVEPLSARTGIQILGGSSAAFTPGTPIKLMVAAFGSAYSVDAYRIDLETYKKVRAGGYMDADFINTHPVRHASFPPQRDWSTEVVFAPLPIGQYAVVVSAGNRSALAAVEVTTLGVFSAGSPSNAVLYSLDLRTFLKRPDVSFTQPDGTTTRADANGLLSLAIEPNSKTTLVGRADDGSLVIPDIVAGFAPPATVEAFFQTDRPLYRPGDRVEYRLIQRSTTNGEQTVPTGDTDVTVSDWNGKQVFHEKRAFGAYGTANGEYLIPVDAALGNYTLGNGSGSCRFTVADYAKPEYVVDVASRDANVVAGDRAVFTVHSRYFFGQPAAGMKLHYTATFAPRSFPWSGQFLRFAFANYTPPAPATSSVEGDAVTGRDGTAKVSVPTTPGNAGLVLAVSVDGRDDSGKTVTGSALVPVTHASFELPLSFGTWFASTSSDVAISLRSVTTQGVPRAHVPVTVSFWLLKWDGRTQTKLPAAPDVTVTTDEEGRAGLTWRPTEAGYAIVEARAKDERGNEAVGTGQIWIAGASYPPWYRFEQTTLAPQKPVYAQGEPAQILVTTPRANVDALVDVAWNSGDRIFVQHLDSVASTFEVQPPPANLARYFVRVWIPTVEGMVESLTPVNVAPEPHRLKIAITASKPKYAPGETARFAIAVHDASGNPAEAEIGVGVVDDSLLALAPTDVRDPFDVFYKGPVMARRVATSWHAVNTGFTLHTYYEVRTIGHVSARSQSGAFQPTRTTDTFTVDQNRILLSTGKLATINENNVLLAVPGVTLRDTGMPSFAQLRSDFRDTAFWSPSVTTDAHGNAVVSFRWPDNLTSYTTAAIGVTQASDVGSGSGSALVTKDYLVRLATPRFMRKDDSARFVASANGPKGQAHTLLRFSAPALGVDDLTVRAAFNGNGSATSDFNVAANTLGPTTIRLAGTAGPLSDGLLRTLPVESSNVPVHARWSGSLPANDSLALILPAHADPGDLRIDLSPSIIAELFAGLRLLDVYPYGCVEQTMSTTLPLIQVEQLAKQTGLTPPANPNPNLIAEHAVARLAKLQHGDGSWGWWEHDPPNPYMTAYALYGLAELRKDGHTVPDDMFQRGVASLKAQIPLEGDTRANWGGVQPGSMWNTRAYMFYALADAAPQEVDRDQLAAADRHAATLNPYALSALGLAHVELKDRAGALPLFAELQRRAIDAGGSTHWSGGGWHYHWEDDPIETTAYALRFYHAMAPADARVRRAIAWLRLQSHGSWWYTTKDTAAAIGAIAAAMDVEPAEFTPHETVRVFLNDRLLRTVAIDSTILDADRARIDVPAKDLAAGGHLRFERSGTGGLYWGADWTRYVRDGTASEIDPREALELGADTSEDFTVTRTYSTSSNAPWKLGDEITVDVTVVAKSDSQFVAIEDPLPAGLEYQPRLHSAGDDWSGLQFFDDRVVFFAARVNANNPLHLRYQLRASTVGSFTAAAPTAYAMYGPPVSAIGHSNRVTILR
jgi:hypothetical protein